mmetsp:Transcript_545/g.1262  ORF Transcript_545/g.1262 Transcript_545/m.1262 type:complete len:208 (-) Transcript_545:95-718(-)
MPSSTSFKPSSTENFDFAFFILSFFASVFCSAASLLISSLSRWSLALSTRPLPVGAFFACFRSRSRSLLSRLPMPLPLPVSSELGESKPIPSSLHSLAGSCSLFLASLCTPLGVEPLELDLRPLPFIVASMLQSNPIQSSRTIIQYAFGLHSGDAFRAFRAPSTRSQAQCDKLPLLHGFHARASPPSPLLPCRPMQVVAMNECRDGQ